MPYAFCNFISFKTSTLLSFHLFFSFRLSDWVTLQIVFPDTLEANSSTPPEMRFSVDL